MAATSVTIRVTQRDAGMNALMAQVAAHQRIGVDVGLFQGSADNEPGEVGTPVAEYAAAHEFGAPLAHIPERPFIRPAMDENAQAYAQLMERGIRAFLAGSTSLETVFRHIGIKAVGDVQRSIMRYGTYPETSKYRPGGRVLVDTGHMRRAVSFRLVDANGNPLPVQTPPGAPT